MEVFLLYDMTNVFLERVGNIKLIVLVKQKLAEATDPMLQKSLKSVLSVFGQEKNEKVEKQLMQILALGGRIDELNEIKETLDKVVDQLALLDRKLTESVSKIVSEIKFQPLFNYFGEIESSINEFEVLISSYGGNKPAFMKELEKFIDNFKAKNIEYKMVNYLDLTLPGSETFMKTFTDKAILMRNEHCCDVKSSPIKFVHDFYLLIAMKIYEANNLLALCYTLKDELSDADVRDENQSYLNNRKVTVGDKLQLSMKNSLAQFEDSKYLTSYLNLTSQIDDKPILAVNCNSKRKFYTGDIKVERQGFVVTGLRFREIYDMIFIQIQVGKLLPMGMIDQKTVYWQELPKPLADDSTSFDKIELSCCAYDDSILMGIKFTAVEDYVALQFYRKRLQSSPEPQDLLLSLIDTESKKNETINSKYGYLDEKSEIFKTSSEDNKVVVKLRTFSKTQFFSKEARGPKGQHPFMRPFFDGSDISFEPKVPLSGAGLMHYTNDDNFAGLFAPFLKTMKYKHITL
ncbi:CLUMA_CG013756, isoform A [Clunio marinus]|uniref:CLUMA_CG013756, isoform A n=1 Tax=Clunio marinus TaxID=568069 RepID=A0A1J1IJS7_9DIPT|nr:CLUMA_CG013756, isoform A [Clunio marinus]